MNTKMLLNRFALLLMLPLLTLIYGCGGGGSADPSSIAPVAVSTLSGTAATGLPIVSGNIMVKCTAGSNLATQSGADGAWTVTLAGQTLPCAAQVSGGTVGGTANSATYHSIAIEPGIVNITPLTDLVVANLAGQAPGSWFDGLSGTALSQRASTAALDTALANVRNAMGSISGMSALSTTNPMTTRFSATASDAVDKMLEALRSAISSSGSSYSAVLGSASAGSNFTLNLPGSGSATSSGSGSGSTGTSTLTISISANGVASPTVTVTGVSKPASQAAFCSEITNASSDSSMSHAIGMAGTFTVNSCSFDGTTGTVSATLALTSPVSITVPYTLTYTYSG